MLPIILVLALGQNQIRAIEPPEKDFYAKVLDYEGIPIKAPAVVADKALFIARDRLSRLLKNLPDARYNLKLAGAELHIIGKDQVTSDLPEHRHLKGKPFDGNLTVDQRTRGLGGLLTSCGEENLLELPNDRYRGRDICTHEFAHCLQGNGLSDEPRRRIREQYRKSLDKGLWKGAYAATNEGEYFAELTMWYFGTHGDLHMEGPKPENGPDGLKKYDAEAYTLLDDLYSGRIPVVRRDAADGQRRQNPGGAATLGLESGTLDFDTPDFTLKLVKASQTAAALQPKGAGGFDFTPADQLSNRTGNGFHHLGDIILRVRRGESGAWQEFDTARQRRPVAPIPDRSVLESADLTPTLGDCPLQVRRTWALDPNRLLLRFHLKNTSLEPIHIGALSIPVVFNNILTGRNLKQAHETCSFFDPYVGLDAGYLQVTRLSGRGPAMVVVPDGATPFEAWLPLNEPMRPNQTFEGTFAWTVHSQAYAENEWTSAEPWNPATSFVLKPGESRTYGLKFLVAPQIRDIEKTLAANGRPVVVGIPGYVLPMDIEGKLFVKAPSRVVGVTVEPKDAIAVRQEKPAKGWQGLTVQGWSWGRARLTIRYADGSRQSVHYYVTKPAAQAVADLGHFLTTKQWFDDSQDLFHRGPSVISYDREKDQIVKQDSRVWIAGLGDEAGSGSWLAAAMKEFGQPDREELAKYEQFVDRTLWGGIQFSDGPNKFGVRKSVFFYEPALVPGFEYDSALNWRTWTSWNKKASEDIGRGYDYPHVVAAYWAMYRVARNHPGMVRSHPWHWYLNQAFETTRFAFSRNARGYRKVGWVELGLMDGDVFVALLDDLKREGWTEKAAEVEKLMKERAERWSHEEYPFGSEMAWDSTGQEEVYAWCRHFGYDDKADVSLNSILGYMPTIPHWGYNGNARRYWDFLYGGKLSRIERQLHHYGSGLNAIPVLAEFRRHPDDLYLLRVGYGGMMGALTNIDRDGFASAAFHSYPQTLRWDAYSGDYGPNFFGHAYNTATYIINSVDPPLGWQAFGGNVSQQGDRVSVRILDSFRKRVFVAPLGLWMTLDSGRFEMLQINYGTVRIGLEPGDSPARLRIEAGNYTPAGTFSMERGSYVIPLGKAATWVTLIRRGFPALKYRATFCRPYGTRPGQKVN